MRRTAGGRIYASLALLITSVGLGTSTAGATVTPVVVAGVQTPGGWSQVLGSRVATGGVAMDSAGRTAVVLDQQIFIADAGGAITLLAGNGSYGHTGDGGPATAAMLGYPNLLKFDAAGNLYFVDNFGYIRKVGTDHTISTVAGNGQFPFTAGGGDGGPATAASIFPQDFAVDNSGNIYISEGSSYSNGGRVRKVDALTGFISTFAGASTTPHACTLAAGSALNMRWSAVQAMATDSANNLLLALECNPTTRGEIVRVTPSGNFDTVVAGGGTNQPGDGGPATSARLPSIAPHSLSSVNGKLYFQTFIGSSTHTRLRLVDAGSLSTLIVQPSSCTFTNGTAESAACFDGYAASPSDLLLISDLVGVAKVVSGTLSILTADATHPHDGEHANQVPFGIEIGSLAAAPNGTLFFASYTQSYNVRSINTSGIVGTLAGNGAANPAGFGGYGGPATSGQVPVGVGLDTSSDGSVYLNGHDTIAKVTSGGTLVKVAGTGVSGTGADGGLATATEISANAVAADGPTVYFDSYVTKTCTDFTPAYPCPSFAIRKVASGTGRISTVYPAVDNANPLNDLAVAPGGMLVFSTGTPNHQIIRLNPATGIARPMALPAGTRSEYLVVDAVGNIFTTSGFNIFKITPWGTVTTVATLTGGIGVAPDLSIDRAGNVYVNQYSYVLKFPAMGVAYPGPKPLVTTVSPAAAQAGASVVITGTNLSGATSVKFGTVASPYFASIAANKLMAIVPAGAPTAKVTVTTAAGSSVTTNMFRRLAPPTQVDAGVGHACARLSDGTAACWGLNSSGQLGNNSTAASKIPMLVPGLAAVTQVAAGGAFSCARLSNGQVRCWGANANGQLGHGSVSGSKVPVSVYASGTTVLTAAASVSAGSNFACAVISPGASGTVRCWGGNASGQLGDGSIVQRTRPVTVLTGPGVPLKGVVSVDAGGSSACATLSSGAVRCWGGNAHGQLGRGNVVGSKFAVAVTGINGVAAKAKSVSVGTDHACAVLSTGGVRCWGANASGQLGDGTTTQRTTPVATKISAAVALSGATAVSAGGAHTCAIVGSGSAARVRCWGSDTTGQLGNTATGVQKYAVLVAGTSANGATSISGAVGYTAIVAPSTGPSPVAVVGWGTNTTYQLGDGTVTAHPTPVVNPVI